MEQGNSMTRFWRLILRLTQKRCKHNYSEVKADILEGDVPGTQVLWCETCGAIGIRRLSVAAPVTFREPRPDYYK